MMVEQSLEKLKGVKLYKLDIGFSINESNVSTMIGRAAHIKFLESTPLIDMLIYRYENLF